MADQTTTVNMFRLPENNNRWTHAAQIKYTDINGLSTDNGDTASVEFTGGDLATEFQVLRHSLYVKTAFASGSGTLTVESGTDGDPNNFITSTDIKTAGPISTAGGVPATYAGSVGSAGDDLMIRVTTEAASGALEDITAGELFAFWELVDFDEISRGYKAP